MRHLYLVNENELAGECGPLRVPSTLKQVPEIAGCATYISLKPPRRRPRAAEVESQQSFDEAESTFRDFVPSRDTLAQSRVS